MDVKQGYKKTELGTIPEDWYVRKLLEITDTNRSICYGIVQTGCYIENGVRCIRVVDISNGTINTTNLIKTSNEISRSYQRTILKTGDLIIALRGKIGELAVVDKKLSGANLTRGVALIAVNDNNDSFYLCYYLSSSKSKAILEKNLNGSALQEISIGTLKQIPAILPPLCEQRAIATALIDVDALLTSLDTLITKKRNIKQATMQQLLTGKTRLPGFSGDWEEKRLNTLGSTYGGLTGKTKLDFENGNSKYIPFLNVLSNSVIDTNDLSLVRISPVESQHKVQKGDLFFNTSSETPDEVGMCSILLEDVQLLYLNSFCFGFRLFNPLLINGLFLVYYFRSNIGRSLMIVLAQGATRYNLSKTYFLQLEIPIPSLKEQQAIATVLSDMDAEIVALEQKRDKIRALKQGMMQELLTGKTRLL